MCVAFSCMWANICTIYGNTKQTTAFFEITGMLVANTPFKQGRFVLEISPLDVRVVSSWELSP
jgi:hypothetical protein